MFKKILIGALLVGVVGVLVYGAVNRTIVKASNGNADQERGKYGQVFSDLIAEGRGRNQKNNQEIALLERISLSESRERGGNGHEETDLYAQQGRGRNQKSE